MQYFFFRHRIEILKIFLFQISKFFFQLFSAIDLFSYIGGVLGLCLGFSAMSALECCYFFALRLGLNIRNNRDEPDVHGSLFEN